MDLTGIMMKLYYANKSPYSRKVRLVIINKSLENQVKEILVDPFANDNPSFLAANPLGKIPTLIFDNEKALYDSPVICHYLDGLSEINRLIPKDKTQGLNVLRWEALADGMIDAAYNLAMERRRPANEQSASWIARWSKEILRVLEYIETHYHELGNTLTLAHLSLASAIGYLDFRLPEILYDSACPQVSHCPNILTWYEVFKTLPAMQATRPYD